MEEAFAEIGANLPGVPLSEIGLARHGRQRRLSASSKSDTPPRLNSHFTPGTRHESEILIRNISDNPCFG
ncbi:MAG TPA: hypothetical protein VEZ40_10050 [Pyrinomonadaceae bacterium]|nr:hypothetical protein [Pyrinomonadaceae bacterium]